MRTAEIAGAGLAGLALAAGLGRRGWRVIVHEAGEVLRSGGGGLYISRDGLWALDQLGQGEVFRRRSFAPTGFETWINGTLHRAHENDRVFRTALRGELHDLLVEAARNAGVEIRTGVRVLDLEPSGTLILEDASRRTADLVVGADGVGSRLFAALGLNRDLVIHQDGLIRVLHDRRNLPAGVWEASKDFWSYESVPLRILYSPCSPDHCYLVMMVSADDTARLTLPTDLDLWAPSFPMLAPILKRAPLETRVDRYSTIRLPAWVRERAVLIGDAAHAMPSSHARGANICLRNAVKLAVALGATDDIDAALAAWETEMRPLTSTDQKEAEHLAFSRSLQRGFPEIDLDALVPANMKPVSIEQG